MAGSACILLADAPQFWARNRPGHTRADRTVQQYLGQIEDEFGVCDVCCVPLIAVQAQRSTAVWRCIERDDRSFPCRGGACRRPRPAARLAADVCVAPLLTRMQVIAPMFATGAALPGLE